MKLGKNLFVCLTSALGLIFGIGSFSSCASTTTDNNEVAVSAPEVKSEKSVTPAPAPAKEVKKEAEEDNNVSKSNKKEFINSLDDIVITVVDSPVYASLYGNFTKPYTFEVKDSAGNKKAGYDLTIEYPGSKEDGKLVYTSKEVKTGNNGRYSFYAPSPKFNGYGEVRAFPTPISNDKKVVEAARNKAAVDDWDVHSQLYKDGMFFCIYGPDDKGNIGEYGDWKYFSEPFRKRGMRSISQAPISDSSYKGKPKALYDEIYNMFTNVYEIDISNRYLVTGTVEFDDKPVYLKKDAVWKFSMKGEYTVLDMKNGGKEIYKQNFSASATDPAYWACYEACSRAISEKMCYPLTYDF